MAEVALHQHLDNPDSTGIAATLQQGGIHHPPTKPKPKPKPATGRPTKVQSGPYEGCDITWPPLLGPKVDCSHRLLPP